MKNKETAITLENKLDFKTIKTLKSIQKQINIIHKKTLFSHFNKEDLNYLYILFSVSFITYLFLSWLSLPELLSLPYFPSPITFVTGFTLFILIINSPFLIIKPIYLGIRDIKKLKSTNPKIFDSKLTYCDLLDIQKFINKFGMEKSGLHLLNLVINKEIVLTTEVINSLNLIHEKIQLCKKFEDNILNITLILKNIKKIDFDLFFQLNQEFDELKKRLNVNDNISTIYQDLYIYNFQKKVSEKEKKLIANIS